MFMGVNYFTEEQVKELEKNPYEKKVSNKSITYAKEFKELYWIDYKMEYNLLKYLKNMDLIQMY